MELRDESDLPTPSKQLGIKSFQRGEIRKTKVFFHAANTYRHKAEREIKDARELGEKMAKMLKAS